MDPILSLNAQMMTASSQQTGAEIDRKAEEFEALVLAQLLRPVFESANAPSLTGGGGPGQEAFNALLHDEYAGAIAARGGVGIADEVKAALIRLQSEQQSQGSV